MTSLGDRSLVVELATGVAIVNGERIEVPPTEFEVLAALAARPGEAISAQELLKVVLPDDPVATDQDLRARIFRLRRRIGDHDRKDRIVGTRPRFGYLIDLPPEAVKVVRLSGSAAIATHEAGSAPDEPPPAPSSDDVADAAEIAESPPITEQLVTRSRRERLRSVAERRVPTPVTLIVIAALLSTSGVLGYELSQRQPAPPATVAEAPDEAAKPNSDVRQRGRKDTAPPARKDRKRQRPDRKQPSESQPAIAAAQAPSGGQDEAASTDDRVAGKRITRSAPEPDAVLYHLFDPESGDHYTTTNQAAANEKQAAGYEISSEGRVFTTNVRGTIAISIDSGSAYVYRESASPSGESLSPLYRLVSDGDFFYTTSSSLANQAQAQGWARSTAGFVAR